MYSVTPYNSSGNHLHSLTMIKKGDWESNPVNPPSYWKNTTK